MKRYHSYFWFFVLTIYCAILISLEVNVSQEYVLNFFTDIKSNVSLYAVNTSLSVFLLLGTSLIFTIVLVALPSKKINLKKILFYRSQVILFGYLALDNRFLIHEHIGHVVGINNALILAGLGGVEIILILIWSDRQQWNNTTKNYLLAAAAFFALMVFIDGVFASDMIPRLSLEDFSKTWANTFIFLFSWSILMHNINTLKIKAQSPTYRNFISTRLEKVNYN